MMKAFLIVLLLGAQGATCLFGQEATASPAPKTAPPAVKKPAGAGNQKAATPAGGKEKTAIQKAMSSDAGANGPITTEIYADEAFFDSNKSQGIFSGRVKVSDPRFNLQSDKLTVYISKGEQQGLEKAIAEGNVGVVRDRPDPNGGPASHAVGRAETATYVAASGDVELKGAPRVQQGLNTHIGTSPDTVMVINQNGQLTTHGPSRTEIRQAPKGMDEESKAATKPETPAKQ